MTRALLLALLILAIGVAALSLAAGEFLTRPAREHIGLLRKPPP